MSKKYHHSLIAILALSSLLAVSFIPFSYAANSGPTSTSYNMTSVKIGSGGIQNITNTSYSVTATVGDLVGTIFSTSFQLFTGFLSTTQAQPAASQIFNIPGGSTTTNNNGDITGITIPQGTTSAPYDVSNSFNSVTGIFTFPADLTATMSFTGGSTVTMILPSTIQFTAGSGFTGSFQMPTEQSVAAFTAPSSGSVSKALSVGFATSGITMSEPVKITISGEAGKTAAFVDSSGATTTVSKICSSATSVTNVELPDTSGANSACTISSGTDLILWTRHFTDVITFTPGSTSGGGGTTGGDRTPPSITTGFSEDEFPLVIGNTKFSNLGDPTIKKETVILKTKTQVPIALLLSDNKGLQNIQHVAIYLDLGPHHDVQFSNAWLSYDKGTSLSKFDKSGLFEDAYVSTSTKNNKLALTFYVTFAKPLESSDIGIRAWDYERNGLSIVVPNALKIIDEKQVVKTQEPEVVTVPEPETEEPKAEITPEPGVDEVPEPGVEVMTAEQKEIIQKWAGFYTVSASDTELLEALNIELPSDSDSPPKLPAWTKNNVGKWALNDKISMKEFHDAINYIVKNVLITD